MDGSWFEIIHFFINFNNKKNMEKKDCTDTTVLVFIVCAILGALGFGATLFEAPMWISVCGAISWSVACAIAAVQFAKGTALKVLNAAGFTAFAVGCIAILMFMLKLVFPVSFGAYVHPIYGGLTISLIVAGADISIRIAKQWKMNIHRMDMMDYFQEMAQILWGGFLMFLGLSIGMYMWIIPPLGLDIVQYGAGVSLTLSLVFGVLDYLIWKFYKKA